MAWRVLNGGQMIEIVTGALPNGREATMTRMGIAGEVIKGELSQSMRDRYDNNDPHVRSLVEHGEVSYDTDDDGNPTETFSATGRQASDDVPEGADEAAAARISELSGNLSAAEQANADLQAQLNEAQEGVA